MRRILFIDYDSTLHDTDATFATKLDGIYGMSSQQILESYIRVHLEIVHPQFPEKHDDFFFHQKLICDHANRPYDEGEARTMARMIEEASEARWTNPIFFADTFYFLDKASEKHTLCLTTGDYAREKADAMEKAAGKSHFSYVFDHIQLGMKGDTDYFRNALMSTNALPEDAVAVGDSLTQDIAAAGDVGITTIWVNRRGLPMEGITPGPDYEARDLLEVLQHLDGF